MKAPEAPDPVKTAQAQAGMNRDTAITQQQLNMVNQVNPWGSVTYDQTGTGGFYNSKGKWVETPTYTATTALSPEQQAIFDSTQAAQGNLAGLASDQSARMRDYLNEPFEYTNQDAENWAWDLASPRILQQQQQNEQALRTQLINSGLRPGTSAWNSEMTRLTNANTDQLNYLALTGRQQAFSEALAARNQPINELSALLSGSQVSNPATMGVQTPQTGVAGVDYTGLVNQQYQSRLQNYQSGMGGLFGLGSALIGALPFSDARLKENKQRVGETDDGTPIYTYNYKGDPTPQMGVMAQDVPDARVKDPSGFYRVDYRKVH